MTNDSTGTLRKLSGAYQPMQLYVPARSALTRLACESRQRCRALPPATPAVHRSSASFYCKALLWYCFASICKHFFIAARPPHGS